MAQQHINYSFPNDGLGDALRVFAVKQESNNNELYSNKIDKVTGKALSDVNFSAADKTKLDSLDPAAGTQSDWDEGNALDPAYINNKPTNVSDFFNDAEYVTDVVAVGGFLRSAGEWVSPLEVFTPKIFDGIIGVTAGFAVSQVAFTLPTGAKCVDVFVNDGKYSKTTLNNIARTNRWSQTGDIVTITKVTVLNNYIYIEYLL